MNLDHINWQPDLVQALFGDAGETLSALICMLFCMIWAIYIAVKTPRRRDGLSRILLASVICAVTGYVVGILAVRRLIGMYYDSILDDPRAFPTQLFSLRLQLIASLIGTAICLFLAKYYAWKLRRSQGPVLKEKNDIR